MKSPILTTARAGRRILKEGVLGALLLRILAWIYPSIPSGPRHLSLSGPSAA